MIHIRSHVKIRQSQSYKFLKITKNSNFDILQKSLQATHLLHVLDKMYKYVIGLKRTVGATEQTRDAGWTDRVKPIYPQPPRCVRGMITENYLTHQIHCISKIQHTDYKFIIGHVTWQLLNNEHLVDWIYGTWSSNELLGLHLKIGYQGSTPGNGSQGDMLLWDLGYTFTNTSLQSLQKPICFNATRARVL